MKAFEWAALGVGAYLLIQKMYPASSPLETIKRALGGLTGAVQNSVGNMPGGVLVNAAYEAGAQVGPDVGQLIAQAANYAYLSTVNANPSYFTNPGGYYPDFESLAIGTAHGFGLDTFNAEKSYYTTHYGGTAIDLYYGITR